MSGESVERELGAIGAQLLTITEAMRRVETKMDNLQTAGCPVGHDHDRRISELERAPEKKNSNWQTVSAIIMAAAALLAIIWEHTK